VEIFRYENASNRLIFPDSLHVCQELSKGFRRGRPCLQLDYRCGPLGVLAYDVRPSRLCRHLFSPVSGGEPCLELFDVFPKCFL